MKHFTILILIGIAFSCANTKGINSGLKSQLDAILFKDQALREMLDTKTTEARKTEILTTLKIKPEKFYRQSWKLLASEDSINLITVEKIILQYGYPGKTLVGEPTNQSAWYVIQHSDKIEKYFPLIKTAGEKKEIHDTLVAKMEDRLLMQQGKEQIYGTQGSGKLLKNTTTGKEEFFRYMWPIREPENVNALRKKVGFKTTVEENAKNFDLEYKIYTLQEIADKLKNY